MEAQAGHNYCRNYFGQYTQPVCITSKETAVELIVPCNVPRCHDCMYGLGDGTYPGILFLFIVYNFVLFCF